MTSAPGAPLACPAAALPSGWRLWLGPPSAAFGLRICHPPPPRQGAKGMATGLGL